MPMSNSESRKRVERATWAKCIACTLRNADGRLRPWWGTDGHNGRERFYTCDCCGRTT